MRGMGRLKRSCYREACMRSHESDSGVNSVEDGHESKRTPRGGRFPYVPTG